MLLQTFLLALTFLLTPAAYAQGLQPLVVSSYGFGGVNWSDILGSIVQVLQVTIISVSSAVFVAGAGLYIISAGDEGRKTQGKQMMIGALIGLAIVMGGKGILNTIMYFIYG